MEWTVGKQDPQVPLVAEQPEEPEQPEQPEQSSFVPEGQSEEATLAEIYEESIQEEKDIVDDVAQVPELPHTWDFMRGGSKYEALSFLDADIQGISTSRSSIYASPRIQDLLMSRECHLLHRYKAGVQRRPIRAQCYHCSTTCPIYRYHSTLYLTDSLV